VGARYSSLNGDDVTTDFADLNKYYAVVLTKYLSGHNLKFNLQLGYNELNDALKTDTQNGTYYAQFQFTVQF
jgi:hypothetical protein